MSRTGGRLREQVVIAPGRPGWLRVEDAYLEVELESEALTPRFAEALRRTRSVEAACAEVSLDPETAAELTAALREAGLLLEPALLEPVIPVDVAGRYVLRLLDDWSRELYVPSFWEALLERDDSTNLFYGWCVENLHYTTSVFAHIGAAIRNTSDGQVADRFVRHLGEEWDHPYLFNRAAQALASGGEDPWRSQPLGSTRALTLLLRHAASLHPFAYKVCVAVLERTASRIEETRTYYRALAAKHGLPLSAVEPLILHAETDGVYDHMNSLADLRLSSPFIRREVLDQSLECARQFVDSLYVWQCQIASHYRRFPPGRGSRGAEAGTAPEPASSR